MTVYVSCANFYQISMQRLFLASITDIPKKRKTGQVTLAITGVNTYIVGHTSQREAKVYGEIARYCRVPGKSQNH